MVSYLLILVVIAQAALDTWSNVMARYDSDDCDLIDGVGFADPGGRSALRAATKRNPRCHPCPTCRRPKMLTGIDVAHGYQCDRCADAAEGGMGCEY